MAKGWDWINRLENSTRKGGMTSAGLAREVISQGTEVLDTFQASARRVMGVGDQQYSQIDGQKFENMPVDDLLAWANEELEDVIVYAVMLRIRLARLRDAYADSFEAYREEYLKEEC